MSGLRHSGGVSNRADRFIVDSHLPRIPRNSNEATFYATTRVRIDDVDSVWISNAEIVTARLEDAQYTRSAAESGRMVFIVAKRNGTAWPQTVRIEVGKRHPRTQLVAETTLPEEERYNMYAGWDAGQDPLRFLKRHVPKYACLSLIKKVPAGYRPMGEFPLIQVWNLSEGRRTWLVASNRPWELKNGAQRIHVPVAFQGHERTLHRDGLEIVQRR